MASSRRMFDPYSNTTVDSPLCSSYPCLLPISFPPSPPLPCPPPPSSLPDDIPISMDPKHKDGFVHNHAVLALTLLACVFAISLLSTAVLIFFHRRLRRRRALAAALIDPPLFPSDPDAPAPGAGPGPDPGDDPIHHVWYIRTVGLDEATIESIAVTKYQAGSGLLGSTDCSVCLGDFQDGDLVRLLPKCGHAFHVLCIDTWLRAHVNCPVCRSHVVDPKVTAADGDSMSPTSEASARDTEETRSEARDSGEVRLDVQSRDSEENEHEHEVFDEIPLSDSSSDLALSTLQADSAEREPSPNPVRYRSASVDSPFMVPSVVITIPETYIIHQVLKESIVGEEHLEQSGKEKERPSNGSKAGSTRFEMVRSFSSSSGSGRAFFFSRSGRSRSSVLPL